MSGNTLLENTYFSGKRGDIPILAVLIGFTLFIRIYLLQMINVGPDEIDYWYSARQIVFGGVYPEIMHRTIRWAIILPVALFQKVLGLHPLVYYVPPVVNSLIQTVILYKFGKRLFGSSISFYSVLLFTAWPYMWRTGSQIRPAIFSLTYILIAFYTLFLFLESDKRKYFFFSLAALFLAYESKITNLYFVPGILIVLWRYKRRIAEPLKYGGYLFILYLFEHLGYWIFTGNKMGRLGIIASHHMKGDFADKLPHGILGLFARYTGYMEFPWKLLFLLFIAATIYLLIKRKKWILELTILHVSFFFFLTFMVKGIHPIEPVEPFLDRYYIVNLPTMSLVIVMALRTLLSQKTAGFIFNRKFAFSTAFAAVLLILIVTALPLPAAASRFVTPLTNLSGHPIPKSFEFIKIMDRAIEENLPVISIDTRKPLDTVNRVIFDNVSKGRHCAVIGSENIDNHKVYYLENVGNSLDLKDPEQRVLWCSRFNFNMRILPLKKIPPLSDIHFSDS